MPPYAGIVTSSSDDEDAPEAFSLAQSKRNVETQNDVLKQFQAREKEKQKERNREKDRQLKERASKKRDTKRSVEGENGVQARMERAMRDAEEEMDDEDESGPGSEDFDGSEGETSSEESDSDDHMESAGDEEDGAMHSDEDEKSQDVTDESESESKPSPAKRNRNPQHLPDHLFTSAFTPQMQPPSLKRQSFASGPQKNEIRKRRHHKRAKDLIVGSRVVRALSNASRTSASKTLPSPKVEKFVNRSLSLKGNNSKKTGWERRPANIGVLKRDGGPAAGFVRGQ